MQASAAILLIAVLIVLVAGVVALLLLVRARLRREFPRNDPRPSPPTDAWAEAGRRLDPPPPDDASESDGDGDDDDDGGEGGPREPVPCTPSLAAGN